VLHEFGTGRQIPVGVANAAVPEIGGQSGQEPFDILAGPVPAHQRLDGEPMAEIVKTRTGMVAQAPQA
jgi:hypothetical protein